MKKYYHVGLGGTFDHLHIGHKSLLNLAFTIGNRVSIGVARKICSKDKLLAEQIEDYIIRKKEVENYLRSKNFLARASIFPLDDIYGSAGQDKTVKAIIVSKETYANALKINQLRKEKKIPPLKIIIIPLAKSEDKKIIRSSRIRYGEIDREGHIYRKIFTNKTKLILPFYLRSALRKPIGEVIFGSEEQLEKIADKTLRLINRSKRTMVISVGDVITVSLLKVGFDPDVKIIDFRARRIDIKEAYSHERAMFHWYKFKTAVFKTYLNQPGTIKVKTALALSSLVKKIINKKEKSWLLIDGEEDLLTLPAVLLAPLGALVLYGQMDLGVVLVEVTEEKKREVEEILKKFNFYTS